MPNLNGVNDALRAALKAEEAAARAAGKAITNPGAEEAAKKLAGPFGIQAAPGTQIHVPTGLAAELRGKEKLAQTVEQQGAKVAGAQAQAAAHVKGRQDAVAVELTGQADVNALKQKGAVDAGNIEIEAARRAAAERKAAENHATQQHAAREAESRATASHQVDEVTRQRNVELQYKKLDARAKYDSYIGHKLSELESLPPRRIPTTVSEHLDDLTPLSNLHMTATEYVVHLREFGEKLKHSKLLVDRRTFTKDIPTTKDDRDIRSIEHLMHHGKPVTAREYERFMSSRVRQHNEAQAREMRLLEGNLQDTPIPSVPGPGAPASLIGGSGTPSTGAAFLSLMTAAVNRIPGIPRSDILNPGLRYVPFNPTPQIAGIALALGITGVVDIKTDGDLTLGPTARLIDNATGFMVDNIKETGPDGKETGHEIGIGLYRSLLMTNTILQNPGRETTFAAGVAAGKADEGLKAVFLKAKMQPAQQKLVDKANVDAKVERELAAERERQLPERRKAIIADAAASAAGEQAKQSEKEATAQAAPAQAAASAAAGIAEAKAKAQGQTNQITIKIGRSIPVMEP